MQKIINQILDVVFPIECIGCEKGGGWICEECARTVPINSSPCCLLCKTKTNYGEFCRKCKDNYNLNGVFIAGDYDNKIIKRGIKTLKYRFIYSISGELAKLLILFLEKQKEKAQFSEWIGQVEMPKDTPDILENFSNAIIMPVPLHKKRLKWRGFNQAEKLALPIAEHFNLRVDTENLQRIKNNKQQAKLKEKDRHKNISGIFSWEGVDLKGEYIILVDDVVTTGSTLEECAKILKKAGAIEVWGAVVAKG
ncbi:MAG: double zinc ribbon domain-containing protein [Patescibacteria group bacterium]|jgi:ComF family protein